MMHLPFMTLLKKEDNDDSSRKFSSLLEALQTQVNDLTHRLHVVEKELQDVKQQKHQQIDEPQKKETTSASAIELIDVGSTVSSFEGHSTIARVKIQDTRLGLPHGDSCIADEQKQEAGTISKRKSSGIIVQSDCEIGIANAQSLVESHHDTREIGHMQGSESQVSDETSSSENQCIDDQPEETHFTNNVSFQEETIIGGGSRTRTGNIVSWIRSSTRYRMKDEFNNRPLENTKSIYMYAIATLADALNATSNHERYSSWKRTKAQMFAILSIILVCLQLNVLYFVARESQSSTCSTHTDCQVGYYCHSTHEVYRQPRCLDCASVNKYYSEEQCDSLMSSNPYWEIQDLDHTVMWLDRSGHATYDETASASLNMEDYLGCLSIKHCEDTALVDKDYDDFHSLGYIDLTVMKLSPDQILVLLFISILFGSIVTEDLTESLMEDALLNVVSMSGSMPFTVKTIRLSLRIRQIVLPWFIASATISVLLTDSLSTKNIVLNFLAISFIVDASKMLARLLLSYDQQTFVERVTISESPPIQLGDITVSSLIPRVIGLFISIFVVGVICIIQYMVDSKCSSGSCSRMNLIFANFIFVGVSCSGICWALGSLRTCLSLRSWDMFVDFSLEFCRAHAAIAFAGCWNFFLVLLMIFQNTQWVQQFGRPVGVGLVLFFILLCIEVWLEKFINRGCSYCRSILLITCFVVTYSMYVLLILYCMKIIG